jgi:hypothetical protein
MMNRVRPQHLPDGGDHLLRENRSSDGLRQHRVERRITFLADQHELVAPRQLAVEGAGERGSGEPAADDDDCIDMLHGRRPPVQIASTENAGRDGRERVPRWSKCPADAYIVDSVRI